MAGKAGSNITSKTLFSSHIFQRWVNQARKRCFPANISQRSANQESLQFRSKYFPKVGQSRKHCFLAMLPKCVQARKHCFPGTNVSTTMLPNFPSAIIKHSLRTDCPFPPPVGERDAVCEQTILNTVHLNVSVEEPTPGELNIYLERELESKMSEASFMLPRRQKLSIERDWNRCPIAPSIFAMLARIECAEISYFDIDSKNITMFL